MTTASSDWTDSAEIDWPEACHSVAGPLGKPSPAQTVDQVRCFDTMPKLFGASKLRQRILQITHCQHTTCSQAGMRDTWSAQGDAEAARTLPLMASDQLEIARFP
jgi:hypothetical protein